MFRKLICIFTVISLLAGLGGCALVSRIEAETGEPEAEKFVAEKLHTPSPVEPEPAEEVSGTEGEETEESEETENTVEYPQIKEDDPMYGDVSEMFKGLTPVFEYFAFKGEDLDITSLSNDDFWLLMAMIAAQVNGDSKDGDGGVSLRKDVLNDYGATFFGDLYSAHGLPDWKGTVSATSDSRSQVVSLSAMAVDGYHGRLAGFEAVPGSEDLYNMYLEVYWSIIEGAQTGTDISEAVVWKVELERWPEGSEHAFAFRMKSFERIEEEGGEEKTLPGIEEIKSDDSAN